MLRKRIREIDGGPGRMVEMNLVAKEWWSGADTRLLPGEEGGVTVFAILFWDGCQYLRLTDSDVFERVDDLVASHLYERQSSFVAEHCGRMGAVVRVVASGLDVVAAAELRDELVAQAPDEMRRVNSDLLEAPDCFLAEVAAEPVRMTFAEWAKTREEGEKTGE